MQIQQLDTANIRLHHSAGDLAPEELVAQPIPSANPIGFMVWHMARSQDWAANTAIRDEPEMITRDPWSRSTIAGPGTGTGFEAGQAIDVSRRVDLNTMLAYADAVHADITSWLRNEDESLLDEIPDAEAHDGRHPEYLTVGFRAEMSSGPEHDDAVGRKGGLSAWIYLTSVLTSVAITHLHRHLGEVDLLKDLLRRGVR